MNLQSNKEIPPPFSMTRMVWTRTCTSPGCLLFFVLLGAMMCIFTYWINMFPKHIVETFLDESDYEPVASDSHTGRDSGSQWCVVRFKDKSARDKFAKNMSSFPISPWYGNDMECGMKKAQNFLKENNLSETITISEKSWNSRVMIKYEKLQAEVSAFISDDGNYLYVNSDWCDWYDLPPSLQTEKSHKK